jgi:peptide deformylase
MLNFCRSLKKKWKKLTKKKTQDPQYTLLRYPRPEIVTKCEEYTPESVVNVDLSKDLPGLLKACNAVSLSANQFGVMERMMAYSPTPNERDIVVCLNPRILSHGENTSVAQEGSVSLPGVGVAMRRYETIEVSYSTLGGGEVRKKIRGWEARIFQHEIDQLDGVFISKVTQKNKTIKKAKIAD